MTGSTTRAIFRQYIKRINFSISSFSPAISVQVIALCEQLQGARRAWLLHVARSCFSMGSVGRTGAALHCLPVPVQREPGVAGKAMLLEGKGLL